ncbi:MAG: cupredoxin domain-containing protein [Thermoplasmata archaeon]
MEYRGPGRGPLAVALAVIIVLSLFGVGTSQATSHSAVVKQTASSTLAVTSSSGFLFSPSLFGNQLTNTSIVVTLTNGDDQPHTFTIASRQGWVIPATYTQGQLTTFLTEYPPLFNVNATPASQATANFTSPAKGWYEFVCTEPGHFQSGMYGFIAFGEPLPSNLTVSAASVGPGEAVFIIVGTIVALTVIAIVLGFVVGRRRGSSDEMPPERLGYPEPLAPAEPPPPPGALPKRR